MRFRTANKSDLDTYYEQASVAQAQLAKRGLRQYVPAAHVEYHDAIEKRAEAGEIFLVEVDGTPAAFFQLTSEPSEWWDRDEDGAFYLSGIVVGGQFHGRRIGERIIEWAASHGRLEGSALLRLDCHAENEWLCRYYERLGFRLVRTVDQHPGYSGCLYELGL